MKAVSDYEWFLKQSNVIYAALPGDKTFTLTEHLDRQNVYLSGSRADIHRWTPQILHVGFSKLGKAIVDRRMDIVRAFISPNSDDMWITREMRLQELKIKLHEGKIEELEKEEDINVICNLLLDWLEHLSEPLLPEKYIADGASYLSENANAVWVWRHDTQMESAEDEAKESMIAQDILDKAPLHTMRVENFRTLTLVISFFRTLLSVCG